MSKFSGLQKILMGLISFIIVLGIILKICGGSLVDNGGYDIVTMLKYSIIDYPIQSIKDGISNFASLWNAQVENDLLRYEISKTPGYKALYEDAQRKNSEYEAALALNQSDDTYNGVWANVILRDQNTWNDYITISKGSSDGIKAGMAVENINGMIGKVDRVNKHTSVVKLLTCEDKTTSASIKINIDDETSVDGVLQSYNSNTGMYTIYLYEDNNNIKKDMQVVTSGMGGGYPSGLLIGNVEQVKTLSNQSGLTIYARPVEDFQSFTIVRVILNQAGE